MILLCIIDGQPINTNKYTGTIYADQSATNFEPIYVAYFNKYWTAKISINIRIWLIKHFDMKNKSSPIVYIIANECL